MKKFKFPNQQQIQQFFYNLPLVRNTIKWSKEHSLPGFAAVPIYDVIIFVFNEIGRFDLFTRANSMAYSFFLALFPSLISLFTLLPYLRQYLLQYIPDNENIEVIIQEEIQQFLPGNVGLELNSFIQDLITNPRVGLLSFGFLLAIVFASNGMLGMMKSFEKSYAKTFKKRTIFRKRIIAIFLTFQLAILMLTSVVFIIIGNLIISALADFIKLSWFSEMSIYLIRWIVIFLLFYTVISIIYRYGAATHVRFKLLTPGATLATILCILSSVVFSWYVNNLGNYNELYGSIGTIIVLMLWIQINSLILLIGFELNASIAINRDLKIQIADEEE